MSYSVCLAAEKYHFMLIAVSTIDTLSCSVTVLHSVPVTVLHSILRQGKCAISNQ